MPLSCRPFSVNVYALSKVWFRSSTINYREGDIKSILSSIKQWIYADLLFKPEEFILFKSTATGGLGLVSIKLKALACLIRTFLELSVNPHFLHSQYLSILFRVNILEEDMNCPKMPPYYDKEFFEIIRVALKSGLDIENMKIKHWYNFLLICDENHDRLSRAELSSPDIFWPAVWAKVS